jgi:predicted Fe-S protein YdhL (DUF1289 family)
MISKNPSTSCIKNCEMDKETQLCKGCFRTISEIAVWGMLNEQQKDLIFNELEKRKLKLSQK